MIQFYNVCKSYKKDAAALIDLNLKIPKGDFVYITGPSGAGKSTLLKLLYAAEKPTRGQILINSQNVTRMGSRQIPFLRRRLGIVFQDFKLLNTRTVFENVAFPLEVQGRKRMEVGKKVFQTLKLVGLEHKLNRLPLELSGGEQQRVALARLMLKKCDIILADEPTGSLDDGNARAVMDILRQMNAQGKTVILVTHNEKIMAEAERVVRLNENA